MADERLSRFEELVERAREGQTPAAPEPEWVPPKRPTWEPAQPPPTGPAPQVEWQPAKAPDLKWRGTGAGGPEAGAG